MATKRDSRVDPDEIETAAGKPERPLEDMSDREIALAAYNFSRAADNRSLSLYHSMGGIMTAITNLERVFREGLDAVQKRCRSTGHLPVTESHVLTRDEWEEISEVKDMKAELERRRNDAAREEKNRQWRARLIVSGMVTLTVLVLASLITFLLTRHTG